MESSFVKPGSKIKGKRLGSILTQYGLAAPTPARKSYMCAFQPKEKCPRCEWELKPSICNVVPIHQEYCFYDGYCTKEIKGIYSYSEELILFLETVTQQFKLTDFEALFILQFFKSNVDEACRQLCNGKDSTKSTLRLSIDAPWQLQPKTISQQKGIKQFSTHTFFKNNYGNTFSKRPHLWRNILMQETFLEAARDSCLRIQRTLYHGDTIQVACILAKNKAPFQVVGLRLPALLQSLSNYDDLMNELEKYFESLVSASKVWELPKKKKNKPTGGKKKSTNNDPSNNAEVKYLFALLKADKKNGEKLTE